MTKHALAYKRCLQQTSWSLLGTSFACVECKNWIEAQKWCTAKGTTYFEKVLIKGIDASSNARVFAQPFLVVGMQGVAHQTCHWAPHTCKVYARSAKRCAGIPSW